MREEVPPEAREQAGKARMRDFSVAVEAVLTNSTVGLLNEAMLFVLLCQYRGRRRWYRRKAKVKKGVLQVQRYGT